METENCVAQLVSSTAEFEKCHSEVGALEKQLAELTQRWQKTEHSAQQCINEIHMEAEKVRSMEAVRQRYTKTLQKKPEELQEVNICSAVVVPMICRN